MSLILWGVLALCFVYIFIEALLEDRQRDGLSRRLHRPRLPARPEIERIRPASKGRTLPPVFLSQSQKPQIPAGNNLLQP